MSKTHMKHITGKWLTPTPITVIEHPEQEDDGDDKQLYTTVRGHFVITVTRKTVTIGGQDKIQRHLELVEQLEDGVSLETFTGKANIKCDRITWDNGACWTRPGATAKDKARMKAEEATAGETKIFEPVIDHGAPPDAAGQPVCCGFLFGRGGGAIEDGPAPEGAPAEAGPPDEAADDGPPPPPKGFLSDDQIEDVIDRINEVVGIWGVSEATERAFIKPPVEMMNNAIAECLKLIMHNPLVDLMTLMMDEAVEMEKKSAEIVAYLNEHFITPLANALTDKLGESFAQFEWIKDKLAKMISMMTQMVTDEVMSKSVEQLQDSDAFS